MPITKEELLEALKTDDGKAVLGELIEKEVSGLKKKRDELLADLRKEKDDKKEINDRLEALEKEKEKIEEEKLAKSGDLEKIKKTLEEKHAKEVKDLTETIAKKEGLLKTHVIGEGLTAALVKAKVSPNLMKAAKALITSEFQGEIGDNDGKPFAKFDGKAVDEFVTEWAQTDAGKHFVTADGNSGGGSNGANGSGKAGNGGKKTMTRSDFDALDPISQAKEGKAGTVIID